MSRRAFAQFPGHEDGRACQQPPRMGCMHWPREHAHSLSVAPQENRHAQARSPDHGLSPATAGILLDVAIVQSRHGDNSQVVVRDTRSMPDFATHGPTRRFQPSPLPAHAGRPNGCLRAPAAAAFPQPHAVFQPVPRQSPSDAAGKDLLRISGALAGLTRPPGSSPGCQPGGLVAAWARLQQRPPGRGPLEVLLARQRCFWRAGGPKNRCFPTFSQGVPFPQGALIRFASSRDLSSHLE